MESARASRRYRATRRISSFDQLKSIQTRGDNTLTSAIHCCVAFDIFFSQLDPFVLRGDVIAVRGDCFSLLSLISLAVITSKVSEVASTYCTSCGKPSVSVHVTWRPTGTGDAFQSNNSPHPNCVPKVIYTATSPTGTQYVQVRSQI